MEQNRPHSPAMYRPRAPRPLAPASRQTGLAPALEPFPPLCTAYVCFGPLLIHPYLRPRFIAFIAYSVRRPRSGATCIALDHFAALSTVMDRRLRCLVPDHAIPARPIGTACNTF